MANKHTPFAYAKDAAHKIKGRMILAAYIMSAAALGIVAGAWVLIG